MRCAVLDSMKAQDDYIKKYSTINRIDCFGFQPRNDEGDNQPRNDEGDNQPRNDGGVTGCPPLERVGRNALD